LYPPDKITGRIYGNKAVDIWCSPTCGKPHFVVGDVPSFDAYHARQMAVA